MTAPPAKPRRRPRGLGPIKGLTARWTAARPISKSIIDAIDDPDLFGGMFDALSWEPWRAFLRPCRRCR